MHRDREFPDEEWRRLLEAPAWRVMGYASEHAWQQDQELLRRTMDDAEREYLGTDWDTLHAEANKMFSESPALDTFTRAAVVDAQPSAAAPEGDRTSPRRVNAQQRREAAAMLRRLALELPHETATDERLALALATAADALDLIDRP